MKQSVKFRVLAVLLTVTLCAATALAADSVQSDDVVGESQGQTEVETQGDSENLEQSESEPEPEYVPDPVGEVSFENLESRLRENNYNLLALEENIAALEVLDYDRMEDDMRSQLNTMGNNLFKMAISGASSSYAASSLQMAYDSLRESFEDLKDGKLQEDNQALIRQLENAQDQLVMAGQSLYVALAGMEVNHTAGERSLEALDRSVEELQLRYDLGQVSSLTLQQTEAARTSAISGVQTLEMNIENYKTQLEYMLGAELTGAITLQPLPHVTQQQLEQMNLEQDLEKAKATSYELFAAQRTLDDAKEIFRDNIDGYTEQTYTYKSAKHQLQAAQYTYDATVQNYELKFRTLYNQVKDYWQIYTAAQTALSVEKDNYASMALKYEQGNLSYNKFLDAKDTLSAAQDKVDNAAIDLFSAYNNYRWAVDYGILN
ncbi:MAG: TolC family protein [Lawsonibacter sp.]|jgi:outer membrane protein TolC